MGIQWFFRSMANRLLRRNAGNQLSRCSIKLDAGFRGRGKTLLANSFKVNGRKPHRVPEYIVYFTTTLPVILGCTEQ